MTATELSALPTAEIQGKLEEAYKEIFNLRFQRAQGQLKDTNSIKNVRHGIARMKTVLRQRELAAEVLAKASTAAA